MPRQFLLPSVGLSQILLLSFRMLLRSAAFKVLILCFFNCLVVDGAEKVTLLKVEPSLSDSTVHVLVLAQVLQLLPLQGARLRVERPLHLRRLPSRHAQQSNLEESFNIRW